MIVRNKISNLLFETQMANDDVEQSSSASENSAASSFGSSPFGCNFYSQIDIIIIDNIIEL